MVQHVSTYRVSDVVLITHHWSPPGVRHRVPKPPASAEDPAALPAAARPGASVDAMQRPAVPVASAWRGPALVATFGDEDGGFSPFFCREKLDSSMARPHVSTVKPMSKTYGGRPPQQLVLDNLSPGHTQLIALKGWRPNIAQAFSAAAQLAASKIGVELAGSIES